MDSVRNESTMHGALASAVPGPEEQANMAALEAEKGRGVAIERARERVDELERELALLDGTRPPRVPARPRARRCQARTRSPWRGAAESRPFRAAEGGGDPSAARRLDREGL